MKIKTKAILYMEGMLDKEESRKFKKKIRNRRDIKEFMAEYKWVESALKLYFSHKDKSANNEEENELNDLAKKDIEKYLKDRTSPEDEDEKNFMDLLRDMPGKQKNGFFDRYGIILNIAASILFLALIIGALIRFSESSGEKRIGNTLFAEYFQPGLDPVLHEMQSSLIKFHDGEIIVDSEDERSTSDELLAILRDGNPDREELLLISVALLKDYETELARPYILDLVEKSDSTVSYPARWYLSLLLLKSGEKGNALQNLRILCDEDNYYSSKACILIERLEEKNID